MVSWVQNKNISCTFALIFSVFVFFFLLFQVRAWSSSFHVHLHHHGPLTWSTTWIGPPYLIHTLRSKVSPRFHQLSKTKLGLLISPFLVIDDNLFTKIFNEIFLDSCCLPKHITMCKDYGQVSLTQIGSISSPYICAKSLDLKACTYAWIRKCGEAMATKWC